MKRAFHLLAALAVGALGGGAGRWYCERSRPGREAHAADRAGQVAIAGRWAAEALTAAPGDPALLGMVARGRAAAGDDPGAAEALARIRHWSPADRLASARLCRRADQFVQADAEAVQLLDSPYRAEALRLRAWAARMRGQNLDAVTFARQAVAAGERLPGLAELVWAHYARGEDEAALQTCKELFAEPGWAEQSATDQAAQRVQEVRVLHLALGPQAALDAAAKWPPAMLGDSEALSVRGAVRMHLGDLAGAEQDLRQAREGVKYPLDAVFDLAEVLLLRNRPEEALPLLEPSERRPDAPARAASLLARARARLKNQSPGIPATSAAKK